MMFFLRKLTLLSLIMTLLAIVWIFPLDIFQVSKLKTHYPHVMKDALTSGPRLSDPKITLEKFRPDGWTAFKDVSGVAVAAIIISEDCSFYEHHGFDADQIKKAIELNLARKKFVRGASTITQQVVKNIFLSRKKSLTRKAKELLLAIWIEKQLSKEKILEIYMNIAEWGNGLYGIGAASRHYFGKNPSELNAKEGAFLAMLLPSPRRYSQAIRRQGLTLFSERRIEDILEKLTQAKYISEEEHDRELAEPLWVNL